MKFNIMACGKIKIIWMITQIGNWIKMKDMSNIWAHSLLCIIVCIWDIIYFKNCVSQNESD